MLKIALLVSITLGTLVSWQPEAKAVILINEILADPAQDANGDGIMQPVGDEFVELVNTGNEAVSLSQWTLSDLVRTRHLFGEGAEIPAQGFFVVFGANPVGFPNAESASGGSLGLNNTGDTLTLRDSASSLVDTVVYGPEGGGDVSLTRFPDATGAFVKHSSLNGASFSPGTTTDGYMTLGGGGVPPEPPVPDSDRSSPTVPEPASFLLLGFGAAMFPIMRKSGASAD